MRITEFIGTCANIEIGILAEKRGRKSSYENAKRLIKKFDISLYDSLNMNLINPWHEHTNIKNIKGIKYLHIINSCVDYIFKIN